MANRIKNFMSVWWKPSCQLLEKHKKLRVTTWTIDKCNIVCCYYTRVYWSNLIYCNIRMWVSIISTSLKYFFILVFNILHLHQVCEGCCGQLISWVCMTTGLGKDETLWPSMAGIVGAFRCRPCEEILNVSTCHIKALRLLNNNERLRFCW